MQEIEFEAESISIKDVLKATSILATGGLAKALVRQEGVLLNDQKCFIAGKKLKKGDRLVFKDYLIKIV